MRRAAPLGLVVVAGAGMLLFQRLRETAPDFDEGVYVLSLRALRAGETLGEEVFAAQPPGFYVLLRTIGAAVGTGLGDVRAGVIALFMVGAAGAWAFARPHVGDAAALLPAAFLAIAPPVPLYGARVLADLPALWLVVAAVGLAATARRADIRWALAAGLFLGAAVSVKLVAAFAAPVVLGMIASRHDRRPLASAAAGAAVVPALLLALHVRAVPELWDSVVVYHREARGTPAVVDRSEELAELFNVRVPFTWLALAAAALLVGRLAQSRTSRGEALVWAWAVASGLFLLWHAPLHPNHLVYLPVPLALAAGTTLAAAVVERRGHLRAAAAGLLVLAVAAGYVQQWRRVAEDLVPEEPQVVVAAHELASRTAPGDAVVSDIPAVAVLAERPVPGPLVDTARLRFQTGSLTSSEVLDVIDAQCVRAVVAGRSFPEESGLVEEIARRFGRRTDIHGISLFDVVRSKRCGNQ